MLDAPITDKSLDFGIKLRPGIEQIDAFTTRQQEIGQASLRVQAHQHDEVVS